MSPRALRSKKMDPMAYKPRREAKLMAKKNEPQAMNAELKVHSGMEKTSAGTFSKNLAGASLASIENGSHSIVSPNAQGLMRTVPVVFPEKNEQLGKSPKFREEDGKKVFAGTEIDYNDLENHFKAQQFMMKVGGAGYLVSEDACKKSGAKLKAKQLPLTLETVVRKRKVGEDGKPVQRKDKDGNLMFSESNKPMYEYESKVASSKRYYDINQFEDPQALLKYAQGIYIEKQSKKLEAADKPDQAKKVGDYLLDTNMRMSNATYPDPYKDNPKISDKEYVGHAIAWQNAAAQNRIYGKIAPDTVKRLESAFANIAAESKKNAFSMEHAIRTATERFGEKYNRAEKLDIDVRGSLKALEKGKEKDNSPAPAKEKETEMALY